MPLLYYRSRSVSEQRLSVLQDVVHIETELAHRRVTRRGRAEAIEANYIALCANVAIPTLANARFNSQTHRHGGRKHLAAVVFRLPCE